MWPRLDSSPVSDRVLPKVLGSLFIDEGCVKFSIYPSRETQQYDYDGEKEEMWK
jgi:hypothetical protein